MASPASNSAQRGPGLSARSLALVAAALILAAGALAFVISPKKTGASLVGGPFTLQMAGGKTISDADLKGHPFIVYFGYTHCPDICPTTLAQISDVLARLPGKPIKVLFVTVDPERDTPALMGDYVSSFDPRILGASGTLRQIEDMEHVYRVYAKKAPGKDGDYAMDHSSVIYLMDATGAFVEAFNLERRPEESAKELASYL